MKTTYVLTALASVSALGLSTEAGAAPLIGAAITGTTTGTTWNTTADQIAALFLAKPIGGVVNPTDNFVAQATVAGMNSYALFGDGQSTAGSANSDATYNILLTFADGATISGQYAASTFTGGTSSTVAGLTYTLTGFGFDRSPVDNVSLFSATPGGSAADYTGQFAFTIAAVPEPASWAMMIAGFGIVGAAMRRRKAQTLRLI